MLRLASPLRGGLLRLSRACFGALGGPPTKKAVPVVLNEAEIEESNVRGSGNGGQAVNKTSNCVQLLHKTTGIRVSCHKTRSLAQNQKEARRMLREKLDMHLNGDLSRRAIRDEKSIKRKKRKRRKSLIKYAALAEN